MDWEMEWGIGTIWDGIWVFGIFAVLIWAIHQTHMRRCDEAGEQGPSEAE
jgi:hypothetical protein